MEEYSGFSPLAYSLDLILPLVDLQQEKSWSPLIESANENPIFEIMTLDWKHVARLFVWFEIIFGWFSSLTLVGIISGLTKRAED